MPAAIASAAWDAVIDPLKLSGAQMILTGRVYPADPCHNINLSKGEKSMPGLLPDVDPDGLLEYSVVYTDRAINHMSAVFQSVMTDLSATLKKVYNADAVAIVPGSGTFGMEAVARQFATGRKCLVIRNGFFSFRWTQIFEMGDMPSSSTVLMARKTGTGSQDPFAPAPIEEVPLPKKNRMSFLHRMWKPRPGCCCRTITCGRLQRRFMSMAACLSSIASRREPSGST
jgi:hypothetical protein